MEKLNDLIIKLKKIISLKKKKENIQNEVFEGNNKQIFKPQYKIGDVVWALMPLPEEVLTKIEKNHRIRPYLILDIDYTNRSYKSLMSTTKNQKNANDFVVVELIKHKNSNILTSEIINLPEKNIKNYMTRIDEKDAIDIVNKLISRHKENVKKLGFVKRYALNIKMGDVINIDGNEYYVYQVERNKFSLFRIYPQKRIKETLDNKKIYINKDNKMIRIDRIIVKELFEEQYYYVSSLGNVDVIDVENKRKEYKMNIDYINKQFKKLNIKENQQNGMILKKVLTLLNLGDIVECNNEKYIYLYTDYKMKHNYFLSYSNLEEENSGFSIKTIPNSIPIKLIGLLSTEELFSVLSLLKTLLKQINEKDEKNEILKSCLIVQKTRMRK